MSLEQNDAHPQERILSRIDLDDQRDHEIRLIKAHHSWVWPVCITVAFVTAIVGQVVQAVLTK